MVLIHRSATDQDIPHCYEIEKSSYPEDEAASLESLLFRQKNASIYFRCADHDETKAFVGFICATRCMEFTKDSLYNHTPNGTILVIHSVAIDPKYRRLGYGTIMLREYLNHMMALNEAISAATAPIEKIMLMAKSNLLTFYISSGFRVNQISPIQHGKDVWYELEYILPRTASIILMSTAGTPYWVVDSFADTFGCGNPAAVVLMQGILDNTTVQWRKTVAKEFNLSETAFLWQRKTMTTESHSQHFDIRFYTCSGAEVDLCGHATLASAAALFNIYQGEKEIPERRRYNNFSSLTFYTKNTDIILTVRKEEKKHWSSSAIKLSMEFPWKTVHGLLSSSNAGKTEEVLLIINDMLRNCLKIQIQDVLFVGSDGEDLFVEVTPNAFLALPQLQDINFSPMMVSLNGYYSRGVIVCSKSEEPGVDFMSRFWAPLVGIPEDPVTGSAHCLLGPYFYSKFNRKRLVGKQMSSRGGVVECEMVDDGVNICRKVHIIGSAILTMNGFLKIGPTK
jgi:PhzF family phenazine biosynthesis protein